MKPLIIGFAGGTGSGKTFIANRILERFGRGKAIIIQHDSYYKDIEKYGSISIDKINFDHPDSLETDLLIQHLKHLSDGKVIHQPLYDFSTHRRLEKTREISPKEIILVEGILVLADSRLRDLMDIKIFIDTDADERLIRRIRRDKFERKRSVEEIMDQYLATVKPMHMKFVEPSKLWADIVLPYGADSEGAIDKLLTQIKSVIKKKS